MTNFETLGEPADSVECFPGSEVPKLTPEEDEAWLALLLPVGCEVTDEFIGSLNREVEISQGGGAAQEALLIRQERELERTNIAGFRQHTRFESAVRRQAKKRFHYLLGAYREDSPLFLASPYIRSANLTTFIANVRLVYQQVDEQLPVIIEGSGNLLTYASESLRRRFEVVERDGLSVPFILLHNPNVFTRKDIGDSRAAFLKTARGVGGPSRGYKSNLQKRQQRLEPVVVENNSTDAEAEVPPEIVAQYVAIAALTGVERELLQSALPNLKDLGDKYGAFERAIADLVEDRDEIRARDIIRLFGSISLES